jgi:hypothetical protein
MSKKTAVSAGPALLENLKTLGKMQRGDMLTVAGANGRFERKTNWLTQRHNTDRTHDITLFDQIDEVLASAEEATADDPGDNQQVEELRSNYIKAVRGLDTLLQNYRSKGSKEMDLIDRLTVVLVDHAKHIEEATAQAVQDVDGLKKTAWRSIKYVNDCRIRSTNNMFGVSYFGQEIDQYIMRLLVRGFSGNEFPGSGRTVGKDLKTLIAVLIRQPISRREKQRLLAATLQEWFGDDRQPPVHLQRIVKHNYDQKLGRVRGVEYGFEDKHRAVTRVAVLEKWRFKSVRRAIRNRFGNCGEKADVAATHLVESTKGKIGICIVSGKGYDHTWVLISRSRDELVQGCMLLAKGRANGKKSLPRDTVVVDGWTHDVWKLRDWYNMDSVPNPRQVKVRASIRREIANNGLTLIADVKWPPHADSGYFRLRYAHLAKLDPALLGPQFTWQLYHSAASKLKACAAQLSQILSPAIVGQCLLEQDIDKIEEHLSGGLQATTRIRSQLKSHRSIRSSEISAFSHQSSSYRVSLGGGRSSSHFAHSSTR